MARDESLSQFERKARKQVEAIGIDTNSMAVVSTVFRVATAVRNYTERNLLNEFNLSFSGFTALWVLWVSGPMESRALAQESGVSKSTLTGVVKTLERLGLVARASHPTDGRRVRVEATAAGKATMSRLFPRFNATEAKITIDLFPAEKQELARVLRIILHTVERGS